MSGTGPSKSGTPVHTRRLAPTAMHGLCELLGRVGTRKPAEKASKTEDFSQNFRKVLLNFLKARNACIVL